MRSPGSVRPVRVLIVEDSLADVYLMTEALTTDCPITVELTAVKDGFEAESLLTSGPQFDLVILDLNLPKMSGLELLKKHKPSAPVVVFSCSWNKSDAERAISFGAKEFVRKPLTYEAYVSAVCDIVTRWGHQPCCGSLA